MIDKKCPVCGGWRELSREDGALVCNGETECLRVLLEETVRHNDAAVQAEAARIVKGTGQ